MHQGLSGIEGSVAERTVVAYPDFSVPFRLYTDASNIGLGTLLAQKQESREWIICCASRTLNRSEQTIALLRKSVSQWSGESKILGII